MFQAAVMMALATQPGAEAPQGPPSTTPLTAQSGATTPAPNGALAASAGRPEATIQPPPAEGQASAGVTSYPASFFAAFQPNTATDMLNRVPGFLIDDGGDVRGFADAVGNVLIDGARPSSKSDDLRSVLRRIPSSQVERIDLIRGGAPGIDMQGKTVVANVIRKKDTGVTGVFAVSNNYLPKDGRMMPAVRLEAQKRENGTALEGSFVIAAFDDDGAGDGPETETAPDGTRLSKTKDNTAAGGVQTIATLAYTAPAFGGSLRVNGQLFGQTYIYDERDQDVTSVLDPPAIEHDRQNQERGEIGVTYDRSFGAKLSTETLYIQQFQGEDYLTLYQDPSDIEHFREEHINGESILRSTATYAFSPALQIESGAEADYNWLDAHNSFIDNGDLVQLPAADVDIAETRGELFGKATWIVDPKLTIEAGLRIEASHLTSSGDTIIDKTLFYPKPRVVFTWSPEAADQFRLRVEEEVSQLDFNNFIATTALTTGEIYAGNPNLNPQQALVVEAAYERRFWKTGDVSFTYRHSALTDVIDRAPIVDPSGDYDAPANIGSGTKDEYLATLNVPVDRFGVPGGLIKANLTWRTSSVIDPTTHVERPISGLRNREGSVEFDQDLPKWRLKWGATYNLGFRQPYYRFSQVEIDTFRPYGELFAEYVIRPGLTLRSEINDIGADFRRTLEVFPDLRSTTAQEYADVRDLYFGPTVYFRMRQAF